VVTTKLTPQQLHFEATYTRNFLNLANAPSKEIGNVIFSIYHTQTKDRLPAFGETRNAACSPFANKEIRVHLQLQPSSNSLMLLMTKTQAARNHGFHMKGKILVHPIWLSLATKVMLSPLRFEVRF